MCCNIFRTRFFKFLAWFIVGIMILYLLMGSDTCISGIISFLWNLKIVFFVLFVGIYFILIKNKFDNNHVREITVQILSAFIGVFLALNINDYYLRLGEQKEYDNLWRNIYVEMQMDLLNIDNIEKSFNTPNFTSSAKLYSFSISNAIQNSIFWKFENNNERILLLHLINGLVLNFNNHEDVFNLHPYESLQNPDNVNRIKQEIDLLQKNIRFLMKIMPHESYRFSKQQIQELASMGIYVKVEGAGSRGAKGN